MYYGSGHAVQTLPGYAGSVKDALTEKAPITLSTPWEQYFTDGCSNDTSKSRSGRKRRYSRTSGDSINAPAVTNADVDAMDVRICRGCDHGAPQGKRPDETRRPTPRACIVSSGLHPHPGPPSSSMRCGFDDSQGDWDPNQPVQPDVAEVM